jgi:esterase/lipase
VERKTESLVAPKRSAIIREAMGLLEPARLGLRYGKLKRLPRGDGQTVLMLPGFGTTDHWLWPLARYLKFLGYNVTGWGLGRNTGRVQQLVPRIVDRIDRLATDNAEKLSLVGWSLGGYIAREAARERPAVVERVITFGSPVVGGPKYTATSRHYLKNGFDLDKIEAQVAERDAVPLRVPITAIYSKRDGIVAWQACIDHVNEQVEHIEVNASHLGMGMSPDVFEIVARRLSG